MGHYINYKCPRCKCSLSNGYRRTVANGDMGLPFVECPNCKTLIKTGKTPYSRFSAFNKVSYWIKALFTALLWGCGIGLLLTIIIMYIVTGEDRIRPFPYSFPLMIVGFVWQMWVAKRNIAIVEDHLAKADWSLEV